MSNDLKLKSILQEEETPEGGYWGKEGAGAILLAKKTGRFLFGFRSSEVFEPGTWGGFGGKMEEGESPDKAAIREIKEETGHKGPFLLHYLFTYKDGDFKYHNYLALVDDEFEPQLNWENDNYAWVEFGDWPEPLHFGIRSAIGNAKVKIKSIQKMFCNIQKEALDTPPPIIRQEPSSQQKGIATSQKLQDAYVIVATLWGEARGEGTSGMQAVLNVIMNRAKGNFDNAAGVALRPKQFSIWNGIKDPNEYSLQLATKARTGALKDLKQYRQAIELVDSAMKGQLKDITDGAMFYFNPKIVNPSWAKKLKFAKRIGNHDFYGIPTKQ